MNQKDEAMSALRKSAAAGFPDIDWIRRDPDLNLLHDDPEFDRLFRRTADLILAGSNLGQ